MTTPYPIKVWFNSEERLPLKDAIQVLAEEAASYARLVNENPDDTISVYGTVRNLREALEQRVWEIENPDAEVGR